jgi:hypothetical protein
MIAGRPTALWAGLATAVLNVIGLVYVVATNSPLDATMVALFAGLNALALAVIGVLANSAVNGSYFGRAPDKS